MGDCFYKRSEPKSSADYYATPPKAVQALCRYVEFRPFIIEPCCGEGHISRELQKLGYDVESSDIIYRGFGKEGEFDFLDSTPEELQGSDIVTNPPYNQAARFIEHALDCADANAKIAMLLRLTFLESKKKETSF